MFPILVTVQNKEQLQAVHAALEALKGGAPAATETAAKPAKPAKPAKETPPAPPATAPADGQPTAFASDFCAKFVNEPLKALCLKDYPAAEKLIKSYGVERASLIPDAKLPEFLAKIQAALDPGAEERKRLEALDAKQPASLF
jgi:hypothetical protein